MNARTPNKPIGLAVTLVILVLCIMLNIIFISKNIGLNQENQINMGNNIIALLSQVNEQSMFIQNHLTTYSEQVNQLKQADLSMQTAANDIMIHELTALEKDIQALFKLTSSIDAEGFTSSGLQGETPQLSYLVTQLNTMTYLADDNLLSEILTIVSEINAVVSQFNFKLEGSKTAMIRMSNGFEWKDTVHKLDKLVSNH